MVDAAVGLQSKGHDVVFYTSHHDPNHCFEETRDGERESDMDSVFFIFLSAVTASMTRDVTGACTR